MTKDTERAQVGWRFWLWWVLASTAGSVVGVAVAGFVVFVTQNYTITAAVGAVVGASIGIAQWLILGGQVPRASWWVLASTVGGAVGLAVGLAVGSTVGEVAGSFVSGAEGFAVNVIVAPLTVVGASIGTAQWLVLRRHVSRSGWWVLASIVGFVVQGGAVFLGMGGAIGPLFLIVGWAGVGAITGGAMVWLLRQPILEKSSPPQDAA